MRIRFHPFEPISKPAASVMLFLLLGACAALPGDVLPSGSGSGGPVVPAPIAIATVQDSEGEAFIIRSGTTGPIPAKIGDSLYDDDRFLTGNGSMVLRTAEGGEIVVYPNTDPRLFKDTACFAVSFFKKGRMRISAHEFCVNGELKQDSTVGYSYEGGVLSVWVLEGHVTLKVPPFGTVGPGERVLIRGGRSIKSPYNREEFERMFPRPGAPVIL